MAVKDAGRFRINVFKQRGEVGMVIRAIKSATSPASSNCNCRRCFRDLIMEPARADSGGGRHRLGKSTTLASMIDHRNSNTPGHILTIEDPIEYLHRHKKSIVNQREVGLDTHTPIHERAEERDARGAGRDHDRRDPATPTTMEAAIAFSETGHLCLATLHSNNADQTLERILNFFPESAHKNVLMNLALNLRAVVSQRLVLGVDGRRMPAAEVLINTPMIRDLLRRGQVHEIKQAMEDSLEEGMESFDQCLFRMVKDGLVKQEEALRAADSKDGLALKFRLSEGSSGEHDPYADVFDGNSAPRITSGFG